MKRDALDVRQLLAAAPESVRRINAHVLATVAPKRKRAVAQRERPRRGAGGVSVSVEAGDGFVALVLRNCRVAKGGNARDAGWWERSARAKRERNLIATALLATKPPAAAAWRVTFARTVKREEEFFDDDNHPIAHKHQRDEIARWLGCGDSHRDPVEWRYAQAVGAYCVTVVVEAVDNKTPLSTAVSAQPRAAANVDMSGAQRRAGGVQR